MGEEAGSVLWDAGGVLWDAGQAFDMETLCDLEKEGKDMGFSDGS